MGLKMIINNKEVEVDLTDLGYTDEMLHGMGEHEMQNVLNEILLAVSQDPLSFFNTPKPEKVITGLLQNDGTPTVIELVDTLSERYGFSEREVKEAVWRLLEQGQVMPDNQWRIKLSQSSSSLFNPSMEQNPV